MIQYLSPFFYFTPPYTLPKAVAAITITVGVVALSILSITLPGVITLPVLGAIKAKILFPAIIFTLGSLSFFIHVPSLTPEKTKQQKKPVNRKLF